MTPAPSAVLSAVVPLFVSLVGPLTASPFASPIASPIGPPVDIGRDQARQEAEGKLLRSGYEQESPVDWLWRKFDEFLGDLLDAGTNSAGGVMSLIVIVVILVVLAALLLWALRRMARGGRTGEGAVFDQAELTAAEHRAAAGRHAADGNWRAAVQERLRAIARDLEERAIVSPLPGRTAMELAETAGTALPSHAAALRQAARVFDDIAYGDVPGTRQAYLTLTALDDSLRKARISLDAAT
ncbi:DUF4129 domain-containing protein [Sphaerimonospora cavernae]|uniref:DUF4129 domain-containing protein n=1 Tax=Sphaerimonospora cavernae TaxID=1740611 RepID=A0ABV6U434_9ACTN